LNFSDSCFFGSVFFIFWLGWIELGFTDFFGNFVDQIDDGAQLLARDFHRFQHFGFCELACGSFNHDGFVRGTGNDQVEIAKIGFCVAWLDDEFSFYAADADSGDRAMPWDVGDSERAGGTDQAWDVGVIGSVMGKDGRDDGDFIVEMIRKEGADSAVDEAAGENGFVGGAAFTLDEARAFDAAGGVHALLVIDHEREVAHVFFSFTENGGTQNDRVAVADGTGAIGLFGELADADREGAPGPIDGEFFGWFNGHKGKRVGVVNAAAARSWN
jgi:hypothetical protein